VPRPEMILEVERLDIATYAAVARTPTPSLDTALKRLSSAADHSKLWVGVAGVLALSAGTGGRRAAVSGLASIGVASAFVNIAVKPLWRRTRPDRAEQDVPVARHVPMPASTSFPSGHSASAFAFATGVSHVLPAAGVPVRALAGLVAYSRVHTGVHYPGDVIVGSLTGGALAQLTTHALDRGRRRRRG
jgi:membrane-associated phospholipid phosphatase